jgi:hypothetical protein
VVWRLNVKSAVLPAGADFEVADTRVPAGTLIPPKRSSVGSCGGLPPFELSAIGPDAVEDDSNFVGYGDAGFLGAYAFDEQVAFLHFEIELVT